MEYTGPLKLGVLYRWIGSNGTMLLLFDYAANLNQQENHLKRNLKQRVSNGTLAVAFHAEEVLGSNSFKVSLLLSDGTLGTLWQTYLKSEDWEKAEE